MKIQRKIEFVTIFGRVVVNNRAFVTNTILYNNIFILEGAFPCVPPWRRDMSFIFLCSALTGLALYCKSTYVHSYAIARIWKLHSAKWTYVL